MRLTDIIRTIQNNFYLAFILLAILSVFVLVGYFIVYKKLLKGNKHLNKRKVFIRFCFIGYLIMVVGVTFLNRSNGVSRDSNLHFLSSYRKAWNFFNSTGWKFIILNIFMFVPLGILLPLLNKRFRKLKWTFGVAFFMTLSIETIQLITGRGSFVLDDIFNNVLGAIIGYGIVMTILIILEKRENKFKRSAIYLIPLMLVIVSSIAIVGVYNSKEYGNLSISHNYKINMKNINLSLNTKIEDETQEVFLNDNKYNTTKIPIYKAPVYNKSSGKQFFIDFLQDKTIDEKIEIDSYNDMAIYWLRGEPIYNMWFYYNGGSYRYTEFSSLDERVEKVNKDEVEVLKELENLNIIIPKSATYSEIEEGIYEWSVDNYVNGAYITNGNLIVEYYIDDGIKRISNNIIKYEKVKDVSIKSKEEAYRELEQGKFNLNKSEDVKAIEVEDINLSYILDTKGFYQPVYNFKSKIDGKDAIISIPAL